ncbi:hypothetical protein BDY17DRAFT_298380 [Neohortaea acidophila]|uniref:Secreted protein n=1 Tax=Neohortaea acidophila TaxID=245834 RepID=A0A6A6PRE0_9PEZI|nr:uncharacterized protein BDY17DRAFT_298380 [Neohortaea acidophila]KAF2482366.1 hypothetical protein BDY17DRAFT_298380 [Neohortaea acidophila]
MLDEVLVLLSFTATLVGKGVATVKPPVVSTSFASPRRCLVRTLATQGLCCFDQCVVKAEVVSEPFRLLFRCIIDPHTPKGSKLPVLGRLSTALLPL